RLQIEAGGAVQLVGGEAPEEAVEAVQADAALLQVDAQPLVDLLVEVLKQGGARVGHARGDLLLELALEGDEGGVDLGGAAAGLVNLGDAALEVDAALQRAQHLVRGAEDALEEAELLREQLEDALVSGVGAVEEVDHDHIVRLAVAVAAA